MRRQFFEELERLQVNVREKEDIIHQLNQEKPDIELLKSTIKTLEEKLHGKEEEIEKLKNDLAENEVNANARRSKDAARAEAFDEVVSDDNEGDGYRIDIDFIKILVDVEADTRALVEKEKTKIEEPDVTEEEKKRTTTKMFDSESLDLEDTITSNLPDLDEEGLEADLMGSSYSQNKKQEILVKSNLIPTAKEYAVVKGDEKNSRLKVPFAELDLKELCSQCRGGFGEMAMTMKEVEEKVRNQWAEEVESLRRKNDELVARYKVEMASVEVNTELLEEDSNGEGYSKKEDIIKMISDVEDDVKRRIEWSRNDNTVNTFNQGEEDESGLNHDEKQEDVVEDEKCGERKKEEKGEEGKTTDEEEYNWNNDIIKMMSEIEDDKDDIVKTSTEYGEGEDKKELVEEEKKDKDEDGDEVTNDEEGYDWKRDTIKMISDIEDDVQRRMSRSREEEKYVAEGIEKRITEKNKDIDDELEPEVVEDKEVGEMVEEDKNKKPCNEETNAGEYNWNNDMIKMMSDIEDDVKRRLDQGDMEYNINISTGDIKEKADKADLNNEGKDKTDEENGEAHLEDEKICDTNEYNWNHDIIKIISDVEDNVEKRIDQGRKETNHILETTSAKDKEDEQRGDKEKIDERKISRDIEEFIVEKQREQKREEKEEQEIEEDQGMVMEQGTVGNKKAMEEQVMEKEEGDKKDRKEENVGEEQGDQKTERYAKKEEGEDYYDFIKMVSDVEDDVDRAWSQKVKKTVDVGVNTMMEEDREAGKAGDRNQDKMSSQDVNQEKEKYEKSTTVLEDIGLSDAATINETTSVEEQMRTRTEVEPDCNKVSLSMDVCSEEQDSGRRLGTDVKMGRMDSFSGDEENLGGGRGCSGEDFSRSMKCISHCMASIFL